MQVEWCHSARAKASDGAPSANGEARDLLASIAANTPKRCERKSSGKVSTHHRHKHIPKHAHTPPHATIDIKTLGKPFLHMSLCMRGYDYDPPVYINQTVPRHISSHPPSSCLCALTMCWCVPHFCRIKPGIQRR